MTKALIPVITGTLAGQPAHLVDGRDLHAFLGVGRDYTTWIKDKIGEYDFKEGEDYSPILGNRSDGRSGKPRTDYHLSLDMAKELAMVERTAKGREARRYFIECERQLLQGGPPPTARPRPLLTADVTHSSPHATAVTWHGHTLYLIDHDGTPHVPLRRLVSVLGLDWHHQHARSHAQVERWRLRVLRVPTPGGRQDATCIPLRLLGDWLTTLERYRIDPTIAAAMDTLVDTLWEHWHPPAAPPDPAPQVTRQALAVPSALDAAIHARAWALAQHAYLGYVTQMKNDPRLADGRQTPDRWLPPDAEILDRVEGISATLEDLAVAMRQRGQRLARQLGRITAATTL